MAVTDELQLIASGLCTVQTSELLPYLKKYVAEEDVEAIVVGEPRQMDNTPSESEPLIRKFLEKLRKEIPNIPIERQDERFTSKMAKSSLLESGHKKKRRAEKALLDEVSATLILQAYLNRIKNR